MNNEVVTSLFLLAAAAPQAVSTAHVIQHNLVSNLPGIADHQDPNLVNCWGLARSAGSPWWVADNGIVTI
jgi:hypothetical protein